jgi:hypothetical protein
VRKTAAGVVVVVVSPPSSTASSSSSSLPLGTQFHEVQKKIGTARALSENSPGKPHQLQQRVLHSLTSSSPQQRPRQSPIVNTPDKEKEEEEDEEQQQKTVNKQRTKQQQQQQQRRRRKRTKTTNKTHWKLDRFQRFLDQKMQGRRPDAKARELPSSRHSENNRNTHTFKQTRAESAQ